MDNHRDTETLKNREYGLLKEVLKSQYLAALKMLRGAIEACPDSVWDDPAYKNRFWRVAYHASFYTDLYLSRSEDEFRAWDKHIEEYQYLGSIPDDTEREVQVVEPYDKNDVLDYLRQCRDGVSGRLEATDMDAASGFYWLPFDKLELQIYNIRDIQHHAAQLIERVRQATGDGIDWVRGNDEWGMGNGE